MISQKRKFIYIDIPKTASTTMRHLLARGLPFGADRTITHNPHCSILNNTSRSGESNNIDPSEIDLKKYFVFTIVRNPFDRAYSYYKFMDYKDPFDEFVEDMENFNKFGKSPNAPEDRVNHRLYKWIKPQLDWITNDDGTVCTNYIGRFETLSDTWEYIKSKIDYNPYWKPLKHLRPTKTRTDPEYRKHYTTHTKKIMEERYKKDLDYFNYEF